jgi:hypothetical protein
MVTSVSPSQSGKQLTATQDVVDQTASFPSISGMFLMRSSRTYRREFKTGTRADFVVIGSILGCQSIHLVAGYTSDIGERAAAVGPDDLGQRAADGPVCNCLMKSRD